MLVRHQDDRRPGAGPLALHARRQGPVHPRDRGGAGGRRDRHRGAFDEGHADAAARRARHRLPSCRARTRATASSRPAPPRSPPCPRAATVGTSSLRRRAQLLHRRPDLAVVEFRGSVQTRLRKLEEGVAAATFLAMAGLHRLGLDGVARRRSSRRTCCPPSPRARSGSSSGAATSGRRAARADPPRATGQRLAAERAFLAALDGSCQTPIAGLAELDGERLRFRGEILRPDGSEASRTRSRARVADAAALGAEAAARAARPGGPGLLRGLSGG